MRRKSGCGSSLVGLGALVAFVVGLEVIANRIDRARFPWGYPDSGRPTLVGTWVGPITTGSGKRLGMLMDVKLAPLDAHRKHSTIIRTRRRNRWLVGQVLMCTPGTAGRVLRLNAEGYPDDEKAASRFHLATSPSDTLPGEGLVPSTIRGRWSGGDSVDLILSLYLRRGKSAITNTADPDTGPDTPATLRRGTDAEFNSLCRSTR